MVSPDLKKLLSSNFLLTFAVQMQSVIIGWRIYDLLRDPLSLGLVGLAEAIPALGLALYAGYMIDRAKPLIVYRRMILISFVSGLILLSEHVFAQGLTTPEQAALLYVASFFSGVSRAFAQPTMFSLLPRMVEKHQLVKVNAMRTTLMQAAFTTGPAFGGFIFGFVGVVAASSLVCIFIFSAFLLISLIQTQIPASSHSGRHLSIQEELFSGLRFVFGHRILLPAMTLDMLSVLFGGVTALLPIFASEILNVGPKGLGLLRAAPAVGSMFMSFVLTRVSVQSHSGRWLFAAVSGFGACILVFGWSTDFILSLCTLVASGAFDSVSMLIRASAAQLTSPDHMRGKISAVYSIFVGSSNELGQVESGIAAKVLGTVPSVYFGGVACLLTVALIAALSPDLRKMELKSIQ